MITAQTATTMTARRMGPGQRCGNGGCPPTVLITGRPDAAIAARARAFGLLAILEKPFAGSRLVELIRGALQSLRT